jgi:hypothetical protein
VAADAVPQNATAPSQPQSPPAAAPAIPAPAGAGTAQHGSEPSKAIATAPKPASPTTANPGATERKPAVALTTAAAAKSPDGAPASAAAPVTAGAPKPRADTAALPVFFFDAKTVVSEAGKNREHDTRVLLADGKVTVTEKNDRVITSLPFADVVAMSVSNSKQPLWNSPQGPAELMKVEAGKLGFLKGGRNWLGLRTADATLVMRVDDDDLRSIIAAIEARTGKKVVRVLEHKD